jgi:hypothetical protein
MTRMVVATKRTLPPIMVSRNMSLNSVGKECTLGTRKYSLFSLLFSLADGTGLEKFC